MLTSNSPRALFARLLLVQLAVLACGCLLLMLCTSWSDTLAFIFGALVCLLGTAALASVALKPLKPGQERIYVQLMGRVQMMRLFGSALLIALSIGWLQLNPLYVIIGFFSIQLLSWILVFLRRSKKRYYYS